jgi:hypothetical protein
MYYNGGKRFGCMAESKDLIEWTPPELGVVEYNGSKANNIVFETKGMSYDTQAREALLVPDRMIRLGRANTRPERQTIKAFGNALGNEFPFGQLRRIAEREFTFVIELMRGVEPRFPFFLGRGGGVLPLVAGPLQAP